jgi:hypothetical protein
MLFLTTVVSTIGVNSKLLICSLVGNKSVTSLKIVYLLYHFLEAGIVYRVETKEGAGFTMRDALGNDGVYGLNILSLFLY